MRPYAFSYPQLMAELLALGWKGEQLASVRRAYEAAERMAAGIQRPSGAGFLEHLVRTASITVRVAPRSAIVSAALLHATYTLGRSAGLLSRLLRRPPRRRLRTIFGDEVEQLIFAYHSLDWNDADVVEGYCRDHASRPPVERDGLMLRLANELEELLDAAICFRKGGYPPQRAAFSRQCARLAEEMGFVELAEQIGHAVEEAEATEVPAELSSGRRLAYRPRFKRWPEAYALRMRLRAWSRTYGRRSAPK